jgi:hypothetical protein
MIFLFGPGTVVDGITKAGREYGGLPPGMNLPSGSVAGATAEDFLYIGMFIAAVVLVHWISQKSNEHM